MSEDTASAQPGAVVLKYSDETVAATAAKHGIHPDDVTSEHLAQVKPDAITKEETS